MDRQIKSIISIFLLTFGTFNLGVAQKLTTVTEEACPRTSIPFQAPLGSTAANYHWDFCTGDLLETPSAELVTNSIPNSGRPEFMDLAFDNGNWYGFITNKNGFNLLRVDFGDKLTNAPNYVDMRQPGGSNLYTNPSKIKVFQDENGMWHGFILNDASTDFGDRVGGKVIKLSFGASLEVPRAQAETLDLELFFPQGLDIVNDNGNYRVLITDYPQNPDGEFETRLNVLDFGNDMEELDTTFQTIFKVPIFSAWNISTSREGNQWQALIWGETNGRHFQVLDFGNDLLSEPTLLDVTPSGFAMPTCRNASLVKEGKSLIALGLTENGDVYRLDFETILKASPQITNLGNFNRFAVVANRPSIAFALAKNNSSWHAFGINRQPNLDPPFNVNELIRIDFPNNCNAIPATSSEEQTQTEFIRPGRYYVNLDLVDAGGNIIQTLVDSVSIREAVVGEFSVANTCIGSATEFINASDTISENNLTVFWEWDFGDGTSSNEVNPIHVYQAPGIYPVSLTVRNQDGTGVITCVNTKIDTIGISNGPDASFVVTSIDCATGDVAFQDLSSLSEEDQSNGRRIQTKLWSFGDGSNFTARESVIDVFKGKKDAGFEPTFPAYTPGQTYVVSLTVIDDVNCSSVISREISLRSEDRPQVNFSFGNACAGVPLQFNDLSSSQSAQFSQVDHWKWTVFSPEGIAIDSSESQNPLFSNFVLPGDYTVVLEARNALACASSQSKMVNIQESIQSNFTANSFEGVAPLTVNFNNETAGAENYSWSFGDGTISTEPSPSYTYQEPGLYEVIFQAQNNLGCGTLFSRFITVLNRPTSLEDSLARALTIFPNPVDDVLKLELADTPFKQLSIRLANVLGKVFIDETWEPSQGSQLRLDAQTLPSGVYLLILEAEGLRLVRRIVKH